MNSALPLDKTDHLRYKIFGRNRDQHVHTIYYEFPFLYFTLFLLGQLFDHQSQFLTKLIVKNLLPIFRAYP